MGACHLDEAVSFRNTRLRQLFHWFDSLMILARQVSAALKDDLHLVEDRHWPQRVAGK